VPVVEFAVNVCEVATPLESVVAVLIPPANVPLAPEDGALNVTTTLLTGFPPLSDTVATSGAANAAPSVALCGVPLFTVIEAAVPTVFVKLKLAPGTPPTEAVTT
jgi:hypothetical protein